MPIYAGVGVGGGGRSFPLGILNNLFGATSGNYSDKTIAPAATRAAAEAVRDAYATANPSWVATYSVSGDNLILFFTSNLTNQFVYQVRRGSIWADNSSAIAVQGPSGSAADFAAVPVGHIPVVGVGRVPGDSGISVDTTLKTLAYDGSTLAKVSDLTTSDWGQGDSTQRDFIKNKPSLFDSSVLASVATSGDYADLLNSPAVGTSWTAAQIQAVVGAMFTNNTETGIALTYSAGRGKIDAVVGAATYAEPVITGFDLRGQPSSVAPGTTISGSQTFTFSVSNGANANGPLTLSQQTRISGSTTAATLLSSTIKHTDTSATVSVGTIALATAGDTVTWELQGLSTRNTNFSAYHTVRALAHNQYIFWGAVSATSAAAVDYTEINAAASRKLPPFAGDILIPNFTGRQHIALLIPASAGAIAKIIQNGFNATNSYPRTAGAITIQGVSYDVYLSAFAQDGTSFRNQTLTLS